MFDVIVIGGGPAGITAALRARELGATVALVERGVMGGTCTNDGCVPTRALAKAARLARDAEHFSTYGLRSGPVTIDFERTLARVQQVIQQIHTKKQMADHLRLGGVTVFTETGDAQFRDPHTITLANGQTLEARSFVICAGGRARRLPFPGAELALTHSDMWTLAELPAALAIVGGAATGCQLASIFHAFGAKVTLLDLAPRLLPGEDQAVSEAITAAFHANGIQVVTGIGGIDQIEQRPAGQRLHYKTNGQPATLDVNAVVLAVGWAGNSDRLNLAAAGVAVERGYITVDDSLRTSVPHIYAAGDINGQMMLVQTGSYDAYIAAENAVRGPTVSRQRRIVPHGGFTDPEYGAVGLTETAAQAHYDCLVATQPYADLDRAVVDGLEDGFCKLVVDRATRQLLGAHVVGEQAVEVVQLVAAAMVAGSSVDQLADLEFAYPTYTAVVGRAARQIVQELNGVPLSTMWRSLSPVERVGARRY